MGRSPVAVHDFSRLPFSSQFKAEKDSKLKRALSGIVAGFAVQLLEEKAKVRQLHNRSHYSYPFQRWAGTFLLFAVIMDTYV